jgi:hypothetical protein
MSAVQPQCNTAVTAAVIELALFSDGTDTVQSGPSMYNSCNSGDSGAVYLRNGTLLETVEVRGYMKYVVTTS